VLDFGLLTAGANTSAMLADLGADVLKIESGAYLDPFRVVGKPDNEDGWWNRSPQFRFTNRNKRGLALNLKTPESRQVILALAQQCDVVVENFRRGVLDRAGLGYKDLAHGQSADRVRRGIEPGRHRARAHERLVRQHARRDFRHRGTDRLRGRGAAHLGHGRELSDQIVSLFAAGMVITAVMEARRTGRGCFLDFSQREVASFTLGEEIVAAAADRPGAWSGAATGKTGWRNRMPIAATTGAGSPSRWRRRTRQSTPSARHGDSAEAVRAAWQRASRPRRATTAPISCATRRSPA
jgi:benzylsuccinate CoA-transferase BbsF subunit